MLNLLFDLKPSTTLARFLAPFILIILWRIASSLVASYFSRRYTVVKELSDVGKARPDGERIIGTAVICGGR